MIILKENVELLKQTSYTSHIAKCASVCYGSKGKRTPDTIKDAAMINMLIKEHHLSVFRHATKYYIISKHNYIRDDDLLANIILLSQNIYCQVKYVNDTYYIVINGQFYLENAEFMSRFNQYEVSPIFFSESNVGFNMMRYTFCVTTQISTSRELNRVSPNNITEESTRFCNYAAKKFNNDVAIVQPYWFDLFDKSIWDTKIDTIIYDGKDLIGTEYLNTGGEFSITIPLSDVNIKINDNVWKNKSTDNIYVQNKTKSFLGHLHKEVTHYKEELKKGAVPQVAREVLPLCTATTVIYTYSVEEWIRILLLRYYGVTGTPHPNAKLIAEKIRENLIKLGYNVDELAETYKNISSNGAAVLTPKQKRESIYSNNMTKNKKSNKDSDKKMNKAKSKKSQENVNENEEDYENVNISETILSELIISDKIKSIQKDKKKKIKGRNNINIIIIGFNEVGKSSFCFRFINNKFEDFYIPSICNENFSKMMIYNDHNYKLNFSVILGGKKIQKQDNVLSTADFFLIIYDITKIRSFNQINIYLKQLRKFLFSYDKEGKNPNFILIGNKSDLEGERKVGLEIVNKFTKKYNVNHFEMSSKTGKNVSNIISSILQIFDKLAYSSK